MTDTPPPSQAAEPDIQPVRRSLRQRFSIVWLVPIGALVISLLIVAQTYADKGRLITIAFDDASGVRADETHLRYRNVVVGIVEEVGFSDNLEQVLVTIRLDKAVEPFVDADAEFWVVSPEVSAQGVSGLDTVLSGVYLEGNWDGIIGEAETAFIGREDAPLVRYGQEGLRFQLRSSTGQGLSRGAPILYRGIKVGEVGEPRLDEDGVSITSDAFIREPEARLITTATRFWDASGFSLSFGAQGAELNVSSLASLLSGGILFDTFISGGDVTGPGNLFRLFPDEDAARASVFAESVGGPPLRLAVIFDDTVGGLEVGAEVVFGGIAIGEVISLTGLVDEERFGDQLVRLLVAIEIQPGRLGLGADADAEVTLEFLEFAVQRGLRAQLQSAGLLGGVRISLDQIDDALPADLVIRDDDPLPILPSIPANLADFADTTQGVFNRLNALPIEELLQGAITVLENVNVILTDEGVTETPRQVASLLGDVRALVASDDIQQLPGQASDVMGSLQNTAGQLDGLVQTIIEAGTAEALVAALESVEEAADSVYEAMEEVPQTLAEVDLAIASLDALIRDVDDLPLEVTVDRVNGILTGVESIIRSETTQALPENVQQTIMRVEELLTQVRDEGLVAAATRTIETTEQTIAQLAASLDPILAEAQRAIAAVADAAESTPELVDRANTLAGQVETLINRVSLLPVERTVNQVNTILEGVDGLVNAQSTQELPSEVQDTLARLQDLLVQVRDEELIAAATRTIEATEAAVQDVAASLDPILAEAQRAAAAIADATEGTPELVARANVIAADLEALVAEAAQLPLDQLVTRATDLLATADSFIASEDVERLPGALADALTEVQRVLIQVQEGGLIENANATLAAAEDAASQVALAAQQLPSIAARLNAVLAEAEDLVSGYQVNGPLGSEARSTLRDIRAAAKSVDSLTRSIERNPNSLLFGR